jgi:peptide deformylase
VSEVKSNAQWIKGGDIPGIVTVGDPQLRQPTREVGNLDEAQPIHNKMVALLRDLNGAGLAGPQIGESLRIFVVEVRKTDIFPDRPVSPLYVVINPRILETSDDKENDWEGCFSIPGLMGMVPRSKRIRLQYTALDGTQRDDVFEGYIARVIQHEYDHLDGILFVDRMESLETLSTVENWRRFYLHKAE